MTITAWVATFASCTCMGIYLRELHRRVEALERRLLGKEVYPPLTLVKDR